MNESEKVVHDHRDRDQKVEVEVDGHKHKVKPAEYSVAELKELVRVPAEKVLEQKIDGKFTPLEDGARIKISGGEVFISHVRRGGSSCW